MRREKKKRNKIIIGLVSLLFLMTVGYAAFQTNLTIKGTSKISSNWDIKITNVTEGNKIGNGENAKTPTWTNLTASMEANLYEKGDAVEYEVTIENKGTFDAKLESISTSESSNEAIKISFSGYTKGEKLYKNSTQTIKVKVEYNKNFNGTPSSNTNEVKIDLNYVQAEGGTIEPTNDYLLTYDYRTNGGEGISETAHLSSNESVDLSKKGNKEGYEFVGWNTDKNAKTGLSVLNMPGEDTVLYAIYKKTLTVTYTKGTGVSEIGKTTDKCDIYNNETTCEITLPTITASEGYSVDGWYNGSNKVENQNTKTSITTNRTFTAKSIDDIAPSVPTYVAYHTSESDLYTSGTWTDKDVYTKVTSIDKGSGIAKIQRIHHNSTINQNNIWIDSQFKVSGGLKVNEGVGTGIEFWDKVNRNETVYFRAVDNAGNISELSEPFKIRYDLNSPTLTLSTTRTTNSITAVTTASATSGITKYEFSKDNGATWIDNGTLNTYTFTGLTHNTAYNIKVRVTSGVGKQTISTTVSTTTNTISIPTYSETNSGEVAITYPAACGSTYTCTYIKNGGSEVTATGNTTVYFGTNGTLVAKISDGTNTIAASTYTVIRNDLYVSSSGNDITGYGTINKPYATIQKAYDSANTSANISIMNDITQTSTANMNTEKTITLQSYSTAGSNNSIIRDSSLTTHMINNAKGNLTLKNIVVDGNNVEAEASMINVSAITNMEDGTVVTRANNINNYGGGFSVDGGTFTINGGEITDNTVPNSSGAAVFVYPDHTTVEYSDTCQKGTLIMNGGKIYNNTSSNGAIFNSGDFTMNYGEIYNGNSERAGGIWNPGHFVMTGGSIHDNEVIHTGGGLVLASSGTNCGTAEIKGGEIRNNKVTSTSGVAGGIHVDSACNHLLTLSGGTISNNTSANNGGGMELLSGNVILDGVTVSYNEAANVGGGVHLGNATLTIKNATISNNKAAAGAGLRTTANGIAIINNVKIINNIATSGGGGIEIYSSSKVTMNGGEVSGNTATKYGAGVSVHGDPGTAHTATFILNGGVIKNNTSTISDGGIARGGIGTYTYKSGTVTGNKPSNSYETG